MAESILFTIPAAANGKVAPYRLNWHQSANGQDWGPAVDTILVANLTVDPGSGAFIWTSTLADPTRHHCIRSQSQAGVLALQNMVIPPRYQFALCQIYIDLHDMELTARTGVTFTFTPRQPPVRDIVFDVASHDHVTDSNGQLSVVVPQGMVMEVSSQALGGKVVTLRTHGQTFINLAHMLG